MAGFVFICGAPRSGTTAFAELLNLHPQIVVGIERFKYLALRQSTNAQFTPELFRAERFFDFRPEDTNIVRSYDSSKYHAASWVGDKVPRYYRRARVIFERFPGAHLFYVLRDIEAVARSWMQRAGDEGDRWPAHNDHARAVEEWNRANRIALRQVRERPDHFHIVTYDDLCSGRRDAISASLAVIGLSPTAEMEKLSLKASNRHNPLPDDKRHQVAQAADYEIYKRLIRRKLGTPKP